MATGGDKEAMAALPAELRGKLRTCRERIAALEGVVVAFSGGVDSTFLLAMAVETLGAEKVVAATGRSPIHPRREADDAKALAAQIGVELVEIETAELAEPSFLANGPDRCYHCKRGLLGLLIDLARQRQLPAVATGANADDTGDFRPGLLAEEELGVARPLLEAGLTKDDIRAASRAMHLPTWDRPPSPCLATRIPYGQAITPDRLARIDRAEDVLRELGLRDCRVRDHGSVARIEVPAEAIETVAAARERIVGPLKALGYTYVALDLAGLRSGSMNEVL